MEETLYFPCIMNDLTGQISMKVGPAMSKDDATEFLRERFSEAWIDCEAIPQPVNHHYFDCNKHLKN